MITKTASKIILPAPQAPLPRRVETRSIHEILSDPESLMALSDQELKNLLEPYIPAARKAVLPTEKPSKIGLTNRLVADLLKDPTLAAEVAKYRETKNEPPSR